jgi:hypothetical protein
MIDTWDYEGHTEGIWIVQSGSVYLADKVTPIARMDRDTNHTTPVERDRNARLIADAPKLLAEVERLREENKILATYMDIVQKYDEALSADGDTDPRWSELYD